MTPENAAYLMGLHQAAIMLEARAATPGATLADAVRDLCEAIDAVDATFRMRDLERLRRLLLAAEWDAYAGEAGILAAG